MKADTLVRQNKMGNRYTFARFYLATPSALVDVARGQLSPSVLSVEVDCFVHFGLPLPELLSRAFGSGLEGPM